MSIKKCILAIMLIASAKSYVLAASVAWGCVNGEYRESNEEFWIKFRSGTHVMDFSIGADILPNGIVISAKSETLISFHNIIKADVGDIIAENTTRHLPHDAYFMHCYIDDEDYYGSGSMRVSPDESFYLMVAIESYITTDPMVLYGWMELSVDANG